MALTDAQKAYIEQSKRQTALKAAQRAGEKAVRVQDYQAAIKGQGEVAPATAFDFSSIKRVLPFLAIGAALFFYWRKRQGKKEA